MFESQAMTIYTLMATAMVGVYLLLPKAKATARSAGALLALGALAGFIVFGVGQMDVVTTGDIYFYILVSLALVFATCVITHKRAVYSALYFVLVMLSVAGILLLLEAEFLVLGLVIIYGGAILITYMFVIMLAQQDRLATYDARSRSPLLACFSSFLLMAAIGGSTGRVLDGTFPKAGTRSAQLASGSLLQPVRADAQEDVVSNTTEIGGVLMTRYVIALQVSGVLLLIAMVGAVAIARRRLRAVDSAMHEEPIELGQVGKKVAPF